MYNEVFEALTAHIAKDMGGQDMAFALLDMENTGSPIVFASKKYLELLDYVEEEVLGQPWFAICGDETDVDDMRALEAAVYGKEVSSKCIMCYKKSGEEFWNHVFLEPGMPFTCISCVDVSMLVQAREPVLLAGETGTEEDVAEIASRIQELQVSTVNCVLDFLEGYTHRVAGSEEGSHHDSEEAMEEGEGENISIEAMVSLKEAICRDDYTVVRKQMTDEGALEVAVALRAGFNLVIREGGDARHVGVKQGNSLHYAVCRSAFTVAACIIVAAPELILETCEWSEDLNLDDTEVTPESCKPTQMTPTQLANRYGEFFEAVRPELAQLYFSIASVMRCFENIRPGLSFMAAQSGRERLELVGNNGYDLLVLLMQSTSEWITATESTAEARSRRSDPTSKCGSFDRLTNRSSGSFDERVDSLSLVDRADHPFGGGHSEENRRRRCSADVTGLGFELQAEEECRRVLVGTLESPPLEGPGRSPSWEEARIAIDREREATERRAEGGADNVGAQGAHKRDISLDSLNTAGE